MKLCPFIDKKKGNYKIMKKVLAVFVAISLLFVMCVPAFAGENVDALTDEKQIEIAGLVLDAVEQGKDVNTISGRTQIGASVVNGISDLDSYKELYEADENAIKAIVSEAVNAVKADEGFSDSAANMLISEITRAIKNKLQPEASTESAVEPTPEETEPLNGNIDTYYSLLSNLPFDQLKSVLVTLLGNGILNKTDAKYIIDKLSKDSKINADQLAELTAAIGSEDASKNSLEQFFDGYTPSDLAQLFRGFGDAISTITSALANLLRTDEEGNEGNNGNNSNNNNNNSNPTDIPPTGDYAFPAVTAVALLAGAAFVLTRKKNEE